MATPMSNSKLRVPAGFQSLLVGLSIEVLRAQPKNILSFAADHFENLLHQRGKSNSSISFSFLIARDRICSDLYVLFPTYPLLKREINETRLIFNL